MQVEKFQRKPFPVSAVRVTEENMNQVRKWCDGEIKKQEGSGAPFIFVRVNNPTSERQNQAFVGDHVVYMQGAGYKIYTHASFKRTFEPVAKEAPIDMTEAAKKISTNQGVKVIRGAKLRSVDLTTEEPDPAKGVYPVEVSPPLNPDPELVDNSEGNRKIREQDRKVVEAVEEAKDDTIKPTSTEEPALTEEKKEQDNGVE